MLEGIVQFNLNELYAASIDPAEILTAWLGSRWHVAAARTESDAWRKLLLSLTSKVSGLQGLIPRDQVLQAIGDLLGEAEFSCLYQLKKLVRRLCEVQHLLFVTDLSAADCDPIQ